MSEPSSVDNMCMINKFVRVLYCSRKNTFFSDEERERERERVKRLTDLIKFKGIEFSSHLGKKTLCGLAIRAVGFAEDGCVYEYMSKHTPN